MRDHISLHVAGSQHTVTLDGCPFETAVPYISQSKMMSAFSCPRRFMFAHRMGIRPARDDSSAAMQAGSVAHAYLESLFLQLPTDADIWETACAPVDEDIQADLNALSQRIGDEGDLDGSLEAAATALDKAWSVGKAMAHHFYENVFPLPEYYSAVDAETHIACGVPHPVSEGSHVMVEGTLDGILQDLRNGNVWIVDHKTSGDRPSAATIGRAWAYQSRLYRLLAKYGTSEGEPLGFVWNFIQRPSIYLCGKDRKAAEEEGITPLDAYLQRVHEWYDEKAASQGEPTVNSSAVRFPRDLYSRGFAADLDFVDFLANVPIDTDHDTCFPKRGHACKGRYGRPCPYYEFCTASIPSWPVILDSPHWTTDFQFPDHDHPNTHTPTEDDHD